MSLMECAPVAQKPMPAKFIWTDDAVQTLRKMVAAQRMAADIMREVGAPSIGFIYRKCEQLDIKLKRGRRSQPGSNPRDIIARFRGDYDANILGGVKDLPAEPSDAATLFVDLDPGRCSWPISDAGYKLMCCGEKAQRGPYCERHHRVAYRKPKQVEAA